MWDTYDQAFGALGVTNRRPIHIASRAQANDPATAGIAAEADGIFMTGGDQKRLLAMIGGSEDTAPIVERGVGIEVAVLTAPGDRRDVDLREIGQTCARAFHMLVVYESDGRGRPLGETARVFLDGAREEGAPKHEHHCKLNVHDALRFGLGLCHEGDVLIFTCSSSVLELVEAIRGTDPETAERIAAEA